MNNLVLTALLAFAAAPEIDNRFDFQQIVSLDEMREFVRGHFPAGTGRDQVRKTFVTEGKATLFVHPTQPASEKYLYDIDLCSYHVFRWNISADFDENDELEEIFVNGEPSLSEPEQIDPKAYANSQNASVALVTMVRPEAFKGERKISAVQIIPNGSNDPLDGLIAVGGPTRADPSDMGKLHGYLVQPWRAIFDQDKPRFVAPYSGDCAAIDELIASYRPKESESEPE